MRANFRTTCLATVAMIGVMVTTVAAQTASASSYQTLYSFQGFATDGANPNARLTAVGGLLYGTTTYGGTGSCSNGENPAGCGTVFSIDPSTGAETVIYNFQGGSDGAAPFARLISVHGALYGTTEGGGAGSCDVAGTGCGTVFELKKKKGSWTESVLYRFSGGADGANPYAGLLASKGVLYGTTTFGGNDGQHCNVGAEGAGCGVVFSLTPSGSTWTESVLYTFTGGSDGANPASDLIIENGALYGTTIYGGNSGCNEGVGCGTLFVLTPLASGWTETIGYTFQGGTDGGIPSGPLLPGKDGVLYGTTEIGGGSGCDGSGCGTVYEFSASGESVIYSFQGGSDSWYPESGVIKGPHGALYGTAYGYYDVGTSGNRNGTVFELTPDKREGTWTYNTLHGFTDSPDGRNPHAGLVETNGVLYGTTNWGGTSNPDEGTVFALTP